MQRVVAAVALQVVGAARAFEGVVAEPAVQRVVAVGALQRVLPVVAVEFVIVGAAVQQVVVVTTAQRVVVAATLQRVFPDTAGDFVSFGIAYAGKVRRSGVYEVFQRPIELKAGQSGLDRVDAFVRILVHDVVDVVDHIGVVACAAVHLVDAQTAVEPVVPTKPDEEIRAVPTGNRVIQSVAGALKSSGTGELQDLEIGPKRELAERRFNHIDAAARALQQDVIGLNRLIGVVSGTACERVSARSADQKVVPGSAFKAVSASAAVQRVVIASAFKRVCATFAFQNVVAVQTIQEVSRAVAGKLIPELRSLDTFESADDVPVGVATFCELTTEVDRYAMV